MNAEDRVSILFIIAILVIIAILWVFQPANAGEMRDYEKIAAVLDQKKEAMAKYRPRIEYWTYCSVQRYANKCMNTAHHIVYVKKNGEQRMASIKADYRNDYELKKFIMSVMVGAAAFREGECIDGPCLFE